LRLGAFAGDLLKNKNFELATQRLRRELKLHQYQSFFLLEFANPLAHNARNVTTPERVPNPWNSSVSNFLPVWF
jgi:hypothetical protein